MDRTFNFHEDFVDAKSLRACLHGGEVGGGLGVVYGWINPLRWITRLPTNYFILIWSRLDDGWGGHAYQRWHRQAGYPTTAHLREFSHLLWWPYVRVNQPLYLCGILTFVVWIYSSDSTDWKHSADWSWGRGHSPACIKLKRLLKTIIPSSNSQTPIRATMTAIIKRIDGRQNKIHKKHIKRVIITLSFFFTSCLSKNNRSSTSLITCLYSDSSYRLAVTFLWSGFEQG